MKKTTFLVGAATGALFLYLSFARVDLTAVLRTLSGIDAPVFLASLVPLAVYFLLRTWRLRILYAAPAAPGGINLLSSVMIGVLVNNLVPAKAGEVARALVLKRSERIGVAFSLGIILVERMFDFMALSLAALFLLLAPGTKVLLAGDPYLHVRTAFWITLGAFGILASCLPLLGRSGGSLAPLAGRAAARVSSRLGERVESWVRSFAEGLVTLGSPARSLTVFLLSLAQWTAMATAGFVAMHAFNIDVGFTAACVMTVVVAMGIVLPPAPGGIGPIQFFSVLALSLYGVPRAEALGFSLGFNVLEVAATTVVGVLFLLRESLSLGELLGDGGTTRQRNPS